jgi:hypothetical protein
MTIVNVVESSRPMPYLELLLHLSNNGDAVASQSEARLTTEHGHVYVRSAEGQEMVNTSRGLWWRTKFIWVRV